MIGQSAIGEPVGGAGPLPYPKHADFRDWADSAWALLTKIDPEEVIRVVFEKLRSRTGAEQETAATHAALG